MLAASALFLIGTTAEPGNDDHDATEGSQDAAEHGESGGAENGESDSAGRLEAEAAEHVESEESERVLGLDVESPGAVTLGVIVSLLAAAVLWIDWRRAFVAVVVGVGAFVVLDVAELVHQARESRAGFAVLAAAVALCHLAVGAIALVARRPAAG